MKKSVKVHKFDVGKFGCEWGYTMDGGEVGELEFETLMLLPQKITLKDVMYIRDMQRIR